MKFTFAKLADKLIGAAKAADAAVQKHAPVAARKIDHAINTAKPRMQYEIARALKAAAEGGLRLAEKGQRFAADLRAKAESASYIDIPTKKADSQAILLGAVSPAIEQTRIYVQICAFDRCFAQALSGGMYCVTHALQTAATQPLSTVKPATCIWHSCGNVSATGSMYCLYHFAEHDAFRNRHCGKKIKHQSLESAIQHASALANKEAAAFAAYQCEVCNAFHVGHHRETAPQN